MQSGGQPGNKNAASAKRWQQAILRALARAKNSVDAGLDSAADKLVALAMRGDKWALDHLAERIDGKPAQEINANHSGDVTYTVMTGIPEPVLTADSSDARRDN